MEAITFDEFIKYGIETGAALVNGMPWNFSYKGYPVTHENDKLYLICANNDIIKFSNQDALISNDSGLIYTCKASDLSAEYKLS